MALVSETGAGLSNANAYWDQASVQSYLADRGIAFTGTSAQKDQAIIAATDYINSIFRFYGDRKSSTQTLSWPRTGGQDVDEGIEFDDATVPNAIKFATAQLAAKVRSGEVLLKDLARGGMTKSESVGPISVSYMDGAPATVKYMVLGFIKGLIIEDGPPVNVDFRSSVTDGVSSPRQFGFGQFDNPEASSFIPEE